MVIRPRIFDVMRMLRLGKILHVTGRGAVLKVEHPPKPDAAVYDGKGRKIGMVGNIFGPVRSPYLSIKPAKGITKEQLASLVGEEVFVRGRKSGKSRGET